MIAKRVRVGGFVAVAMCLFATPVAAEWKAGNADVASAAQEPRIAAVLSTVNRVDAALIADDHAAFAAALADDLTVNNPQNEISARGMTAQLNASGRISYHSYVRTIEYAGLRGGMVVLMGEERVVPKRGASAGQEVVRRFTDLWAQHDGRWVLTARQATNIMAPDQDCRADRPS